MTLGTESLPGWRKPTQPTDPAETPKDPQTQETGDAPKAGPAVTTGGGSENEPVVVWEAENRLEAQIVKGRLESEGIPAFLSGEALGTIYGLTTGSLAETHVLVPGPLAQQARDILATEVEWDETTWNDEEWEDATDSTRAESANVPPDKSDTGPETPAQ